MRDSWGILINANKVGQFPEELLVKFRENSVVQSALQVLMNYFYGDYSLSIVTRINISVTCYFNSFEESRILIEEII